jgi:hypothetical protein
MGVHIKPFVAKAYITRHLGSISLTPTVSVVHGSVFSHRCNPLPSCVLNLDYYLVPINHVPGLNDGCSSQLEQINFSTNGFITAEIANSSSLDLPLQVELHPYPNSRA